MDVLGLVISRDESGMFFSLWPREMGGGGGVELIDLVLVFNAESAAKVTSCDTTFPGAKHTLSV